VAAERHSRGKSQLKEASSLKEEKEKECETLHGKCMKGIGRMCIMPMLCSCPFIVVVLFPHDITFHLTRTDLELRGSTLTLRGAVEGAVHEPRQQKGKRPLF
jgi:hypothetical protein